MSGTPVVADSTELLNRVLLMDEARVLYEESEEGVRDSIASLTSDESDAFRWRNNHLRLERIRDKAWTRYLRRWADACEHGHAGHWFEPWIAKKEAT